MHVRMFVKFQIVKIEHYHRDGKEMIKTDPVCAVGLHPLYINAQDVQVMQLIRCTISPHTHLFYDYNITHMYDMNIPLAGPSYT